MIKTPSSLIQTPTVADIISGTLYFYQCELPHDADRYYSDNHFVGYRVGSNVQRHKASGLGIYSNFRDFNVDVMTAVEYPSNSTDEIKMKNIFTVQLDHKGKISSVVNGRGPGPTLDSKQRHPFRCINEVCSK